MYLYVFGQKFKVIIKPIKKKKKLEYPSVNLMTLSCTFKK